MVGQPVFRSTQCLHLGHCLNLAPCANLMKASSFLSKLLLIRYSWQDMPVWQSHRHRRQQCFLQAGHRQLSRASSNWKTAWQPAVGHQEVHALFFQTYWLKEKFQNFYLSYPSIQLKISLASSKCLHPSIGHNISIQFPSILLFRKPLMHQGWKMWPHQSMPKKSRPISEQQTGHSHPFASTYWAFFLWASFSCSMSLKKANQFCQFSQSILCCLCHLSRRKLLLIMISSILQVRLPMSLLLFSAGGAARSRLLHQRESTTISTMLSREMSLSLYISCMAVKSLLIYVTALSLRETRELARAYPNSVSAGLVLLSICRTLMRPLVESTLDSADCLVMA